ncbi:ABC transporter permease [Hydrogenimonas thermophila]|uniref:Phospholipid/cholesterol/gamma-HCH transport system permease protein n=1 Tax=Hydrogenimonas thermophila TaxID=223786 RepID=A0A1I5NX67_9BACT|nr:ABC transporter permease [Hydrogenimonas thermophila]SFP26327.1 phospholipid/cholesterol/gamma-HCH transport system permease protein [Hydrogenimonas thermophila]
MNDKRYFYLDISKKPALLYFKGRWEIDNLSSIEKSFKDLLPTILNQKKLVIDLSEISSIDTGSMIFFITIRKELKEKINIKTVNASKSFCQMFRLVKGFEPRDKEEKVKTDPLLTFLNYIGKKSFSVLQDFLQFVDFLGHTAIAMWQILLHPSKFRIKETVGNIYTAGTTALPIVALSAFLVGIVIAFQSAVQLQKYGGDIFIVDMIGISIPRELAPLITAIIVAGRSGSSYTAQIGVMKITEEIDAMKIMGFDIYRFLVIPRIAAMIIALPLLIFFADIIGIYGGLLVAKYQLDITPAQFLDRLHSSVDVRHYLVGILKAPFFAFIIAAIGCFRGFQVSKNTESIGKYTTISVVNSIFLVIALDAIFSIIFTELDI